MRTPIAPIALALWLFGCGGSSPPAGETPPPAQCQDEAQCQAQFDDRCPGGSVALASCEEGHCVFDACSSPIGTPCDSDPGTVFEGENCD